MPHPHRGLPATPGEIGAVLDLLRKLADELIKVDQEPSYVTAGDVLAGVLDAIEPPAGIVPTYSTERMVGWQVGTSLLAGGGRHL